MVIYEVACTESFAPLFGRSAYVITTVLAIFLGGLALGSVWLGKSFNRFRSPAAAYGWMQIGVAASGVLSVALLAAVRASYLSSYPALVRWPVLANVMRLAGAATVLLVPSILMGGTLPILLGTLARPGSRVDLWFGRLFSVNALGAALGALTAGFLFLPRLGLRLAICSAAALSLAAGAAAFLSAGKQRALATKASPAVSAEPASRVERLPSVNFALVCFAAVGATAVAYTIGCARLLATPLGNTTCAFSLMLATLLTGIAMGSFLFERWFSRPRALTLAVYANTQTAMALAALLFLILFQRLPAIVPPILRLTQSSFGGLVLAQGLACALTILPVAVIYGFAVPVGTALLGGASESLGDAARAAGGAYAANIAGAILGALSGLVVLPLAGSYRLVAIAGSASVVLAVVLELLSVERRRLARALQTALLAGIIAAGVSSYFYNQALACFSAVLYGDLHDARLSVSEIANTEDVVFFKDGISATIAVTRSDDYVALKVDGKIRASNVDQSTQLLLGGLGAIFHPHPRRVLILGFADGLTASAVSRFPDVERIDCAEIEPAVVQAAPKLERLNRGVLQDPRLHLILDDARHVVHAGHDSYDLIISQPSNPWSAEIASLYTEEFYAAARKRLSAGGIFVQWVEADSLEPAGFASILATLSPHFPDVSLWESAGRDFLVLARSDAAPLTFQRSRGLWSNPQLQDDFRSLRLMDPESWPVYFRLSDREVRAIAQEVPPSADNRPLLEYRATQAMLNEKSASILDALVLNRQKDVLPAELSPSERPGAFLASAESAVELNSPSVERFANLLKEQPVTLRTQILLGRIDLLHRRVTDAVEHFETARPLTNNPYDIQYWLAIAQHKSGSTVQADTFLDEIIQSDPQDLAARRERVKFARDNRDWQAAVANQEKLLGLEAAPAAQDFCRLGNFYVHMGDAKAAEATFREGLKREPYSFTCHLELGELLRATGRSAEAEAHLEFVVKYFPEGDVKAYVFLALAYGADHRFATAEEVLNKGRRVFPGNPILESFRLPR